MSFSARRRPRLSVLRPFSSLSSLSLAGAALVAVLAIGSRPAHAIGFVVGGEVGGYVGAAGLNGGVAPSLAGGDLGLVLAVELLKAQWLRTDVRLHLQGGAFGLFPEGAAGAGGYGGGDVLLRLGLPLPLFEPFLEVGGGVGFGGGSIASSVNDVTVGAFAAPAGYAGVGATLSAPLLPYIELRVGAHVGGGYPLSAETAALPDPLGARVEAHLGAGYRFSL